MAAGECDCSFIVFAAHTLARVHASLIRSDLIRELSVVGFGSWVAIGRGDDSNVDLSSSFFADPFNFAILNNSQQLGLKVQRDLANLIEE